MLRARVLARRSVLLSLAGVLALLASLTVVLSWPGPTAQAANPGKPGFLAFTSTRNSELVEVPLTEEITVRSGRFARAAVGAAALRPGTPVRLTTRPGMDEQPSATGRNRDVVFVSTLDDPAGDLYVRDGAGNVRRLLESPGTESDPALSPDGDQVAFVSDRGGNPDIWVVNTKDGTDLRRVTVGGGVHSSPTWSPDDGKIAYSSTKDDPQGSLYVVDVDNALSVTRLTTPADGVGDIEPAWGISAGGDDTGPPDPGNVVFTRVETSGRSLYQVSAGGGTPSKLNTGTLWADQPAWLGTGMAIAFRAAIGHGVRGIFTTDRFGRDRELALSGADKRDPTWSHNGDDLTVVATTDEFAARFTHDIWTTRTDRTDTAGLTRTAVDEEGPAYSPDGRRIAYSVDNEKESTSIVVANADGTGATPITNTPPDGSVWDSDPSWSPDGKRLVFGRVQNKESGEIVFQERRIFTVADTGGAVTDVSPPDVEPGFGGEDPDWSVKDKIAYVRVDEGDDGAIDEGRLYVNDLAEQDPKKAHTRVTGVDEAPIVDDRDPEWSPDGETLVFSQRLNDTQSVLATLKPVTPTGTITQLTTAPPSPTGGTPPTHRDMNPAYSPDGIQIAFERRSRDQARRTTHDIWLLKTSENAPTPFTDDLPGEEEAPTWQPSTDLTLTKTGPKVAEVDKPFTYRLTVTNNTTAPAPDVKVIDELAEGVELVSAVPSQGDDCGGRPLECKLGTLAAGATATVELTVETAKRGVVLNRARVESKLVDSDPSDNTDLVRTPVRGTNLVVTAEDDPDPVDVGNDLTYRIKVTRREGDSARAVVLTVPVPDGMTLLSAKADQDDGTCTPPEAPADPVRCTWPLLGGEDEPDRTVTVVLEPTRPGSAVTTVEVSSATGELNAADNTARIETEVQGTDLTVGLAVTPPSRAYVGGKVAVHAVVSNIGTGVAENSRLELKLPAIACPKPVAGKCPATTTVILKLGRLGPGASATRDVTLPVAAAGERRKIRATALTDSVDVVPDNNTASLELSASQPKLVLTSELGPPGFVVLARGTGFPPNTDVSLRWRPGITTNSAKVRVKADGTFAAQVIVVRRDQEGPRKLVATGTGFAEVTDDFLVVSGNVSPLGFVTRS